MIRVLIGPKGTGKTKTLISWVEQADQSEHGHVVCIAKDDRYNFSVPHSVRLIDTKYTGSGARGNSREIILRFNPDDYQI